MNHPTVFADFHNADAQGRLRLNCFGTAADLSSQRITLQDGLGLLLYSEDLQVEGDVCFSTDEHLWVAVIDWSAITEAPPTARGSDEQSLHQRRLA